MNASQFREQLAELKKKFVPNDAPQPDYRPENRMIQAGLELYQGPWTRKQAAHLLRRTMFGATVSDIDALASVGMEQAVDSLMVADSNPPLPVNNYNTDEFTDPDVPWGQTWLNHETDDSYVQSERIVSLKGWFIERMLNQARTIEEKMVFFWHNHLVTESWGVFWANKTYEQFDLFRKNALGNFKDIMYKITIDRAMLLYLNGVYNSKEAPDENYARELQELFCIGKGPNAGYTEDDVKAAARVLTGWSINWGNNYELTFNFWAHDTEDKQFSSFYNNRVITGRSGQAGRDELQDLIDMIFDTQECALFFCRKLYRFFVYSEIDQMTELNVIQPMAQMLRSNNYEVAPVLNALLSSAHFYTDENIGASVKSPLDFLIGLWRSMKVDYPIDNLVTKYHIHSSMIWYMGGIGLEVLDPPNVAGYPAYYQIPQFDKYWITTDTVPQRALITDSLIWWGFWSESALTNLDPLSYVASLNQPSEPDLLIDEICENLLAVPLTAQGRAPLKTILLSGQMSDFYWTNAWLDYINDPGDDAARNVVETRLKLVFQRLFQMAEFHLT